jgi:hypothetical protein
MSFKAVVLAVALLACNDGQAATNDEASPTHGRATAGGIVDSIVPASIALERFIAGVPVPARLDSAARSPDVLVALFVAALEKRDSAAIARMLVTRAEYGHLYYPASEYSRKPYELAPDIAWSLSSASNRKAAGRLLGRLGGESLSLERYTCATIEKQGLNTIHSGCQVTYRDRTGTHRRRLFKSFIEREGKAKFLSYAGDF